MGAIAICILRLLATIPVFVQPGPDQPLEPGDGTTLREGSVHIFTDRRLQVEEYGVSITYREIYPPNLHLSGVRSFVREQDYLEHTAVAN